MIMLKTNSVIHFGSFHNIEIFEVCKKINLNFDEKEEMRD